jgi:hypothetical protein
MDLMGYQLVVWEGERPADDAAGEEAFQEICRRYLVDEPVPPTPAILAFVEELTELWTDDTDDPAWERSPWKFPPVLESASGPALYLNMTLRMGPDAARLIADLAERRGLVTFDLWVGVLRPTSERVLSARLRELYAPFN